MLARANPLLNIPIGWRLALGFLIPAIIAALSLSSLGVQSQQRLVEQSTFYQKLFDANNSLTAVENLLQQMHTDLQQTVAYAARPQPLASILKDDQSQIRGLASQLNVILITYIQNDLLDTSPSLEALFDEAGHGALISSAPIQRECSRPGKLIAA